MQNQLRTYYYCIMLPHGALRRGLLRMTAERDLSARLRLEQDTEGTVLTLWRLPNLLSLLVDLLRNVFGRGLRLEDLAGFLRDMGLMLQAGVSSMDALQTLSDDGEASGKHAVGEIARRMMNDLQSGVTMAQAFARQPDVFPETVRNLIHIGDQSGTLGHMLSEAGEHVERLLHIRRDIRTALIYPLFVFATIFAVALFWVYYVVPNMALLFRQLNAKLPPITLALVNFSHLMVDNLALGIVVMLLMLLGAIYAFKRVPMVQAWLHEILHRLPVARVLMEASGMAHLTEHLAILVRSGLDFVGSLDILARSTKDRYYQHRIVSVREGVSRGDGIALAMRRTGGFPAVAVRMIGVGEQSGSLDQQLGHLAVQYRRRLDNVVRSLAEIIKPAVILIAGALFIFLIVALLLPVYDLVQQSVHHSLGDS